ncbi:MAG: AAA family ATPase [Bryobacteraceae bacterium]
MEALVLGTILRCGEPALHKVGFLKPDDFAVQRHRTIFTAILDVAREIDPTVDAISHYIHDTGKLGQIDGLAGLLEVHREGLLDGGLLEGFGRTLREKTIQRRAWMLNSKVNELLTSGCTVASPEIKEVLDQIRDLGGEEVGVVGRVERVEHLPPVGADVEPFKYVREPELPEGSIVTFTGDSGCGKSTLATAFIRDAIANGIPALILDRENPRCVIQERNARLRLSDGPFLHWWGGWNGDIPGAGAAAVRDWVSVCDPKPIVLIDSLIAFIEGDENSSSVMRAFFAPLRRLADLGATVIVIHHDGKADSAKDFRGSSDFKPGADQCFHVVNMSGDPGRLDRLALRCFKSRYGLSGTLVYHYADGRFVRDDRVDAPARNVGDQLTALLRTNPGVGVKKFEDLAARLGLGRNRARDFLANGVLTGVVSRETGARNQFRNCLVEDRE